jgi:hypothetical protein
MTSTGLFQVNNIMNKKERPLGVWEAQYERCAAVRRRLLPCGCAPIMFRRALPTSGSVGTRIQRNFELREAVCLRYACKISCSVVPCSMEKSVLYCF